jgi:hypothetical protein
MAGRVHIPRRIGRVVASVVLIAAAPAAAASEADRAVCTGAQHETVRELRTVLAPGERADSRLTLAPGGRAVVRTRVTTWRPDPLEVEVEAVFVGGDGTVMSPFSRTFRLPRWRGDGPPGRRVRTGVMTLVLDEAVLCAVTTARLTHRRLTPAVRGASPTRGSDG